MAQAPQVLESGSPTYSLQATVYVLLLLVLAALSACATRRPELSADAIARFPERIELTETPFFPQDAYQCGPAALATVLHTVGVDVQPQALTNEVFLPGKQGSLAIELLGATRSRGLLPYLLQPTPIAILEELSAGRPVLVMQNVGFRIRPIWHFAVLIGYDSTKRAFVLRSGTFERLVMNERSFMRTWDLADRWALVVLPPDQLPANPDLERYMSAAAGLESIGLLQAAERAYARARAHWPESAWPLLGLANVSFRKGDLRAAEEGYLATLAIEADSIVANNNVAELLWKRGCTQRARPYLERAIELAQGTALEAAVARTQIEMEATPQTKQTCDAAEASRL